MMIEKKLFGSREEWLAARSGRIGGSDAAAIVGESPYMSNTELWEIKAGTRLQKDISEEAHVKYGAEAEEHLRALFALDFPQYDVLYEPNNMWLNDRFPFAHASLDGWLVDQDGRKGILEIKTARPPMEKWKNQIPQHYFVQVLHCLMVTEFDFAIVKAQIKYDFSDNVDDIEAKTIHRLIERSDFEADIEYLQSAERTFWKQLQVGKKPALILPEI